MFSGVNFRESDRNGLLGGPFSPVLTVLAIALLNCARVRLAARLAPLAVVPICCENKFSSCAMIRLTAGTMHPFLGVCMLSRQHVS
jgi:hypothetical protein